MYKAIITKYIGPSLSRGSRIKAYDSDRNSVTFDYSSDLDNDENHRRAAYALRDKMGWKGELIDGGISIGRVWVFLPSGEDATKEMLTKAMSQGQLQHYDIGYISGWREALQTLGIMSPERFELLAAEVKQSLSKS